jgi:long-subunit fatty acid transport protein
MKAIFVTLVFASSAAFAQEIAPTPIPTPPPSLIPAATPTASTEKAPTNDGQSLAQKESTTRPQFFYQPSSGKAAISIEGEYVPQYYYSYSNQSGIKLADAKSSGSGYGIGGLFGITDNISIGLSLAYASIEDIVTAPGKQAISLKNKGMGDVGAIVMAVSPADGYMVHYGAGASVSPEKRTSATSAQEGNMYSGGHALQPYLGISSSSGRHVFGGFGKFKIRTERTVSDNGSPAKDTTYRKGNSITAGGFYEYHRDAWVIDASLQFSYVESTESESSGVTEESRAYNAGGVSIGWQAQISQATNFRIEYSLSKYPEIEQSPTIKSSAFELSSVTGKLRF